jgi:hypothetical protein
MAGEALAMARRQALARSANFDEREPALLAGLRKPGRPAEERERALHWAELAATHSPDGKNRLRVLAAARLRTGDGAGALEAMEEYYTRRERLRFGALGAWGGAVYCGMGKPGLRLRDGDTGELGVLLGDELGRQVGSVVAGAKLADGSLLTVSSGRRVHRWRQVDGPGQSAGSVSAALAEPLYRLSGRSSDLVALSSDGTRLASGGSGGVVVVLEASSGLEVAQLGKRGARITALAVSGDGAFVASQQSSGLLRLWDVERQQVVFERELEHALILSLALDRDGGRLALMRRQLAGNFIVDGVLVSLWDVGADRELELVPQPSWDVTPGAAGALLFDGRGTLAVGTSDVVLLDGKDGAHLRTFTLGGAAAERGGGANLGKRPEVQILSLQPDHIIVACTDRKVRRLDLPSGDLRYSSREPLNLEVAELDGLAFFALALLDTGQLRAAGEALADLRRRYANASRALARMENGAELVEEALARGAAAGL